MSYIILWLSVGEIKRVKISRPNEFQALGFITYYVLQLVACCMYLLGWAPEKVPDYLV